MSTAKLKVEVTESRKPAKKNFPIIRNSINPGDIELHSNRQIFIFDKYRKPHIKNYFLHHKSSILRLSI